VLERGRRWEGKYPRDLGPSAWIYNPDAPHKLNGWLDLRFLDDMIVAQGAAVGGGSLIYANISVDAPEHIFERGWPSQINYAELKPYYDRVAEVLDVQELPDNQLTRRFKNMRAGATALGHADRFRKLPLAVSFDKDWHYDLEKPIDVKHSKSFTNKFGRRQGTCVHLGNCDIGCDANAKNTLDLNYLAGAENAEAEVRPLHVVTKIVPRARGYRVEFNRIDCDLRRLVPGSVEADEVVIAAGSLGSTELLLRCRDEFKTLPAISGTLGHGWSSNGDFLTPSFHKDEMNPSEGPTITCAIDFLDGTQGQQEFFIEDGGFPNLLRNFFKEVQRASRKGSLRRRLVDQWLESDDDSVMTRIMPWFAQGIDAGNGRLYLGRKWYAPWQRKLKLDWEIDRSRAVIEAIIAMHKRLAEATGAHKTLVPLTWELLGNLVTPHPLGGCNMGASANTGVVDHKGAVFGYPGLYVVDGAIVPEAIGRNPSKTIAALAERATDFMTRKRTT
jgi:cholesterol oxidase